MAAFHPEFILLDLGVSSRQLDEADRGFTFRPGAPLDMRMGAEGASAGGVPEREPTKSELARVFHDYGDERQARRLAREVVRRRERRPFAVSDDLVNAIRAVLGPRAGPPEFARLFQAVRIAVNDELDGLATRAARVSRRARARRPAGRDHLSFGRGSAGEAGVPGVGQRMRLPAAAADLHLSGPPARPARAAQADRARARGSGGEPSRAQRAAPDLPGGAMRLKGRHWLMLWLLVFLCVLLAITTRQTAGFRTARRLHDLREERLTLEARRADLERRIRVGVEPAGAGADRPARARPARAGGLGVRPVRAVRRPAGTPLMAKPAARIAAIQFGFAVGVLAVLTRAAQVQIVEARALGGARRSAADREGGAARAARRAVRPERRPAGHHAGVLSRRRRAQRAGGHPRRHSCCWFGTWASGARAQPRVPGAEALDLSARPVHRHAGAAAPAAARRPHHRRVPAILSLARAGAAHHRRARSRRAVGGRRARAVARLDPHRPSGRSGAAQGSGGAAVRVAEPRDPGAGGRQRRDADDRRGAPGDRGAGTRRRARRRCRPKAATWSSSIRPPASCWRSRRARRPPAGRRARPRSPIPSSRAPPRSSSPRPRC